MKIAIGICGIGYGHSSRQLEVARRLVDMGHEVRILTFDRGYDRFLTTEFADRCHRVFVPWIDCDARGVRWFRTARMNWRDALPGMALNRRTFASLRDLGFRPDVCVSDYEPVTARLARRVGAPLVTLDQQSKFLGYQIASLNGMSRQEERSRLAVFFPTAAKRIATSFYAIPYPPDGEFRVELVPPIIRSDVAKLARTERALDPRLVLVYLGAYRQRNSFVETRELARRLGRLGSWRFRIYSQEVTAEETPSANVRILPTLKQEFLDDLGRAAALICTAGHTLLSEAMCLGIPVLTTPLFTYDQHMCAHVIDDAGVGVGVDSEDEITEERLDGFLARLDEFRSTIASTDKLMRADPEEVLTRVCDEIVSAA